MGLTSGCVVGVVAGLLEGLRSGMRVGLSRGVARGSSRGWHGWGDDGLMLATQRAFVLGLPTGRRVGRQAVSPRLADGAGEVARRSAGVYGAGWYRDLARRAGQAGGCVDGVAAGLIEGL